MLLVTAGLGKMSKSVSGCRMNRDKACTRETLTELLLDFLVMDESEYRVFLFWGKPRVGLTPAGAARVQSSPQTLSPRCMCGP